jgi:signal transduction histidine kinase
MDEIVDFLQSVPNLSAVPREQLEWLVRESEIFQYEPGLLSSPGEANDMMNYLMVVLEGGLEAYAMQSGQRRTQMTTGVGAITGMLPFSRMKYTPVYINATGNSKLLALHSSKFHALISANYELTEVIVHTMVDRVRLFTTNHFQNEKLMALGKLSAGLAHELNNPAAAVLRSAQDLKEIVGTLGSSLRAVTSLHLTPQEIESLGQIIDKASKNGLVRLPLLERKRREGEISDWLAENKVATDCEETFADSGITIEDLETLKHSISESAFHPFINWLSARLQTEKTVHEIAESSRRISELVQSVKSYTRMDQAQAMDSVCINDGIRNTITMLEYKARRKGITINVDLETDLPLILGFPGELNQVWTNLIDNAIDAMNDGGELIIQTSTAQQHQVAFSVIDNGPGIAPENLERIFDPFFTTKDVGEGTGVGLDLVRKVVQQHQGKIDVNSRPGRTEFKISFPIVSA